MEIPEDLQEWYKTLDESRENTAACSCAEICRLIERIALLEAENERLKDKYTDSFEQLGVKSLAELVEKYDTKVDALKAQVERLQKQLDAANLGWA